MASAFRYFGRLLTALALVLSLAACESHGSVAGGGTDNGGGGRVKLDLPF